MSTETVTDLANEKISLREQADMHPLELAAKSAVADDASAPTAKADATWATLPLEQRDAATVNIDVFLDEFTSVVQGGPRERCQILWNLFHQIDQVFRPNK